MIRFFLVFLFRVETLGFTLDTVELKLELRETERDALVELLLLFNDPFRGIFCRFRWRQQYRRQYPDEVLGKSDTRGRGDYQIDYVPAPRITEADKTNDRKYGRDCK